MAKDYPIGITPDRLKGTKTEQNLHTALAGEAQAHLRYKWFEEKAKQDGFVDVSEIFCETAHNEMEHAEIWFKYLGGYSTTEKNLDISVLRVIVTGPESSADICISAPKTPFSTLLTPTVLRDSQKCS